MSQSFLIFSLNLINLLEEKKQPKYWPISANKNLLLPELNFNLNSEKHTDAILAQPAPKNIEQ